MAEPVKSSLDSQHGSLTATESIFEGKKTASEEVEPDAGELPPYNSNVFSIS